MIADRWVPVRALLPGALAFLSSCVQVAFDPVDGGAVEVPHVAAIDPRPGAVPASAGFRVTFSAPMDLALLLAAPDRSDSVVLAPAASADLLVAAMAHGRLGADERALAVAAVARVSRDVREIDLVPKEPLIAGEYELLISGRLKDAEGRRVAGNGERHAFTVAAPPLLPRLDTPGAGSAVPWNLQRIRVSVPEGFAGPIGLVERGGGAVAGPVEASGGDVTLEIPPGPSARGCGPLCSGREYSLTAGGVEVAGASFRAAACARPAPPVLAAPPAVVAGDTWIEVRVQLDWPALLRLDARPTGSRAPAVSQSLVRCAPPPCGPPGGAVCSGSIRISGLAPATRYDLVLAIEDDEGHAIGPYGLRAATLGALPAVMVSEVMASPPLPVPRSDGEYIELLNTGDAPVDLGALAVASLDGGPHALLAVAPPRPAILVPGQRALAVGASFDEKRYAIPVETLVARAATHRLLGHGLADRPHAMRLLWIPGADAGAALVIDGYPGDGPTCPLGASLERGDGGFRCGADGGSPGAAP